MRKITMICIVGLLLAAAGNANAEPTLLSSGSALDTIYGCENLVEIAADKDQLWYHVGDFATAKAEGKWAGYIQNLGYLPGTTGSAFGHLFTVCTNGYLSGNPSATFSKAETGNVFRFANDPSGASMWSSQVSDNWDGKDHMRTFLITGGASAGNYVICWEDLPCLGDRDYQDLIVEISGASIIPAPSATLLGSIGTGLVWWLRRRRTPSLS